MEKKELRAYIRAKKQAMTPAQIQRCSQRLTAQLPQTEAYQKATALYGYLPYNEEVQTWALLRQAMEDGKRVAVPKVYGDTMRFLWITDFDRIGKGYRGIPEPIDDGPEAHDPTALVLMPGLAFDHSGRRIGYGGGFYDKFLAEEPLHPTVALCYDFQLLERVPADSFDMPVDLVLSAPVEEGD